MTLHEISEASTLIQEAAHEDANIIFGAVIDEKIGDELRVTVIATGFDQARVSYPEQTSNYVNLGVQGQFAGNQMHGQAISSTQTQQATYMGITPPPRPQQSQNGFVPQNAQQHAVPQSSPARPAYQVTQQPFSAQAQSSIPVNPFSKPQQQLAAPASSGDVSAGKAPVLESQPVHTAPVDDNTESALRIAKELSDVEIDDMDFIGAAGERSSV